MAESAIEARWDSLLEQLRLLCCPGCHGELELGDERLRCTGCDHGFEIVDGIPLLFWPNEWCVFRTLCPERNCPRYLFPDQHPNANGYRIVAETVVARLAGSGRI